MSNRPLLQGDSRDDLAIDQKIEEQAEFVRWWRDSIRRKGGDGGYRSDVAVSAISVDEAEKLTGISKPKTGADEELVKTGTNEEPVSRVKLEEAGIDRKLSSRAQKLADVPEAEFEGMIGTAAWVT